METIRVANQINSDVEEADLTELVGFVEVEAGYEDLVEWPVFAGETCEVVFVEVDDIPF